MTSKSVQSGSAHVIVIIVLSVALVGSLGFLFWQNFINKPVSVATEPVPSKSPTSAARASLQKFCAPLEKLCFDYPGDWTVTASVVDGENDGKAEEFTIKDTSGKSWLRLETGLSGVGGMCANNDNSYSKILTTHTSGVKGSYLVSDATKEYVDSTAYAFNWITYDGTKKDWSIDMELSTSKSVQNSGKIDPCDIGIGVISGKNAKSGGISNPGALTFKYYDGPDTATYATEALATSALAVPEAVKAYDILVSARYE